jgi:hypothetical protein
VDRHCSAFEPVFAGALCALSLASKVSAVWAPIANHCLAIPIFLGPLTLGAIALFTLFEARAMVGCRRTYGHYLLRYQWIREPRGSPMAVPAYADAAEATAILVPLVALLELQSSSETWQFTRLVFSGTRRM